MNLMFKKCHIVNCRITWMYNVVELKHDKNVAVGKVATTD